MIKSAYLNTSVFGGYFDEEFSEDTIPLFERIVEEQIIVIVSELLEDELSGAPVFVSELFEEILNQRAQYVNVNEEVEQLASNYIEEKVV
ncbi:MAG: hypothetical protein AAF363_15920 [Bacteroidota bacterium]